MQYSRFESSGWNGRHATVAAIIAVTIMAVPVAGISILAVFARPAPPFPRSGA